jgi:hypothetical protein
MGKDRKQKADPKVGFLNGGGARRDRTVDLLHAMQALSQLSYSPTKVVRFNRRYGIPQPF